MAAKLKHGILKAKANKFLIAIIVTIFLNGQCFWLAYSNVSDSYRCYLCILYLEKMSNLMQIIFKKRISK